MLNIRKSGHEILQKAVFGKGDISKEFQVCSRNMERSVYNYTIMQCRGKSSSFSQLYRNNIVSLKYNISNSPDFKERIIMGAKRSVDRPLNKFIMLAYRLYLKQYDKQRLFSFEKNIKKTVKARDVAYMEPDEMWPGGLYDKTKKQWRANEKEKYERYLAEKARKEQSSEEGMFTCSKCKSKRTYFYQMQTRSADEPMTTFVTCLKCENRWKC
jgi:DNA-directed RNA polymerase subunit M/transcription elongation factor TFIIS